MACTKTKRRARNRTQRFTSNVFSMFNEAQISEFKEAFLMIDSTKDGVIDKHDLEDIFVSLGKSPNDDYLNDMLSQAPGQINFTMFLTLFGEKMMGCDPEETILNAFACFDPEGTGVINEKRLRELMTTMGDRWSDEKVDELFHGAPIQDGNFDYKEFTRMIMHGQEEEEGQTNET
ncbi:Myosin regulatory light chain sqh isoform 1 [Schistosoma japonicum]|uniref:Myosin regulatory light chain sqh isoform 1 n=2 Tax=Schistosoma japonicum TaxID=6182 RepID=Q86ES1_SCHJA|nr:SJCHGC06153 protein [Schistosoma japonicum]KAH8873725.1 Myosin regulatory light chain 12A [Schistosoma japonicum]TNN14830.1 Myosin regulatory light chain sqh isoform 1 [Schistosoma japonicum]CAX70560.1 spaghetti squash [Schistosoma japonicum]CAX75436.1 spaghetti squash [Schistosoma japonicum]